MKKTPLQPEAPIENEIPRLEQIKQFIETRINGIRAESDEYVSALEKLQAKEDDGVHLTGDELKAKIRFQLNIQKRDASIEALSDLYNSFFK